MSELGYSSVFCGQLNFESPKPTAVAKTSATKTSYREEKDNPVYSCTKNVLTEDKEISFNEEGLRRLTGKYDSPGNVMSQLPTGFSTGIPLTTVDVQQHALVSPTFSLPSKNNMIFIGSAMSDGSSDLSWPGSSDAGNIFAEGVQEHDLLQVEMFYRSHKTDVTVGKCLANLYFGSVKKVDNIEKWDFVNTGIPLLILDTGEHHRNRKLSIVLAEKGTGFTLWKDSVDHLTKYSSPSSNFHTMHVSTDHNKLAGLSFDDTNAASEFFNFIETLCDDPDDDLMALSKKKKKKEKKARFKPPKRSDISQPCCFLHITKLEPPEMLSRPKDDTVDNELSSMVTDKLNLLRSESSEISEDSISHSERL